ncbi:hypothetical protein [Sagittula sp. SSi028]|uniref:hypothetical protein n=1 Tax=Sagittula sp. SSi028 TaxID=3400636 RepID=UPI003AF8D380
MNRIATNAANAAYGGRGTIRRTLYLAALTASRFNSRLKAFKARLLAAGKDRKPAIASCARKLLTVLNVMIKTGTPDQDSAAWNTFAPQELEPPPNPGRLTGRFEGRRRYSPPGAPKLK